MQNGQRAYRSVPKALEIETLRQKEWRNNQSNSTDSLIPEIEKRNRRLVRLQNATGYKILEFPSTRRKLLGADSVLPTPRLKAFKTNVKRLAKFTESMDPCFEGRNAAALQYTKFANVDESTRRRMSNAATPIPETFEDEWAKLNLAPCAVRGRADLQEAALIMTIVT